MRKLKLSGIGSLALLFLASSPAVSSAQSQCPAPAPLAIAEIPARIGILGLAPQAVATADFNLDGYLDLAVSYLRCDGEHPDLDPARCREDDKTGRVLLLLGKVEGFQPLERAPRFATGGEAPRSLAVGDFNSDCYPDLVVSNYGSPPGPGSVALLINDQQGSFMSLTPPHRLPIRLEGSARGMASADLNKDDHLDLVVSISNKRLIAVLKGDAQGRLDCCYNNRTGPSPLTVVVADFNGDGFADLATANDSSSESVTIFLNNQQGDFTTAPPLVIDDAPSDLAVGDLNQDGAMDIVTAHALATDSLWVWLGDGKGGFAFKERFLSGIDPIRVLLADINADGFLDAISVNGSANQIYLLLGDGLGNLGAPRALDVGQTPIAAALGDFNHDGLIDLIVANQTSNDVSIWVQPRAP